MTNFASKLIGKYRISETNHGREITRPDVEKTVLLIEVVRSTQVVRRTFRVEMFFSWDVVVEIETDVFSRLRRQNILHDLPVQVGAGWVGCRWKECLQQVK